MSKYRDRAIQCARSIKQDYKRIVGDKPDEEIDIVQAQRILDKLYLLNNIFSLDVADDKIEKDELCSITFPLVDRLKELLEH